LASPLLQFFISALLHDFEQPEDLASPSLALTEEVEASDFAQQDFAGASLLVLTFSVLAFEAEVTF